jgi:uncharacterized damage-inducible protein DinB
MGPSTAIESNRLAAYSLAVRESSLKRLRTVSFEHVNWRPAASALSIADIAQHIADADLWLFAKLRDPRTASMRAVAGAARIHDPSAYRTLLEDLAALGKRRAELILGLSAEDMERLIDDDRLGGRVSVWWVIVRGNLDHETHHRGQLAGFLRIMAARQDSGA